MLLRLIAILLLLWLAVEVTVWLVKYMRRRLKEKLQEIEQEMRSRAATAARPGAAGAAAGPREPGPGNPPRAANQAGPRRLVRCATCGVHFPAPPGGADGHADVYCSQGCERAAAAGPS